MQLSHHDPANGVLIITIPEEFPATLDFSFSVYVVTCGLPDPGEPVRFVTFDSERAAYAFDLSQTSFRAEADDDRILPRTHCSYGIRTAYMVYFTKTLIAETGTDVCTWRMFAEETGDYGTIDLQLHFRGTNPNRVAVSAELGTDVMRAIAWNESKWRHFSSSGLPLRNSNTNGTSDWGLMQLNDINNVTNEMKWNWRDNIAKGISIYEAGALRAKAYLETHGNYDDLMLLKECIQRYNGRTYFSWNAPENAWQANPPSGYVARVLAIIEAKPW